MVGKNTEIMLEKAEKKDPPAEEQTEQSAGEQEGETAIKQTRPLKDIVQAPERFVIDKTEKNLKITADAPITVPEGDQMNIMRVVPGDFSQEQVTAIWDEIVGDTEMFYTSYDPTKSEIEEAIIFAKQRLANAENEVERREMENQIAVFEQEYPNAPDERIAEKTDSTLKQLYANYIYMGSDEKIPFLGISAESADKNISFNVKNSYTDINGMKNRAMLHSARKSNGGEAVEGELKIDQTDMKLSDTSIPQEAEGLDLSPKEAAEKAQEFLDQANIPFSPVKITLCHNQHTGDWYYHFYCTRNAGNIPSALILGSSYIERDGGWAETWDYEVMFVTIDNIGVRSFSWEYPLEVVETVVEDSNLMTYADAQAIFEKMASIIYEYQADECNLLTLKIDEVKLETMRILEQNKKEVGLLVPVWNFYGVRERTWDDRTDETSRMALVSINAIDGSVIDTVKGY